MSEPTPPAVCSALEGLHIVGPQVKDYIAQLVDNDTNVERVAIVKLRVRSLLDTAGYILQGCYGLPDGYLGAGGGGKPPLLPTDTSNTCGLPSGS
jgi:hypothetical protein